MRIELSRRKFIRHVGGASAATILHPILFLSDNQGDPRIDKIVAKSIGTDTHNHIDVPLTVAELPGPAIDLAGEIISPVYLPSA